MVYIMSIADMITLGIGPGSDITALTLTGLDVSIVFTGLTAFGVDSQRRIEALDVPQREGAYLPSLITLPDGSGYWLFGDGSRIMWGSGNTGTGGKAKRRLETLKVKRNG